MLSFTSGSWKSLSKSRIMITGSIERRGQQENRYKVSEADSRKICFFNKLTLEFHFTILSKTFI